MLIQLFDLGFQDRGRTIRSREKSVATKLIARDKFRCGKNLLYMVTSGGRLKGLTALNVLVVLKGLVVLKRLLVYATPA